MGNINQRRRVDHVAIQVMELLVLQTLKVGQIEWEKEFQMSLTL